MEGLGQRVCIGAPVRLRSIVMKAYPQSLGNNCELSSGSPCLLGELLPALEGHPRGPRPVLRSFVHALQVRDIAFPKHRKRSGNESVSSDQRCRQGTVSTTEFPRGNLSSLPCRNGGSSGDRDQAASVGAQQCPVATVTCLALASLVIANSYI
jgi:hypothetical protein